MPKIIIAALVILAIYLLTELAESIIVFNDDMQVRFLETIAEKGGKVPFVLKTGRGSECRSQKLY